MQRLGKFASFYGGSRLVLMRWFSAFAVGFVSNVYGRFFNGNAFVVMVNPPQRYQLSELNIFTDHRHPLPGPFWSWQRRTAQLCIRSNLWVFGVVSERVPDGIAVDFGGDWAYSWAGNFVGGGASGAESEEGGWDV